MKKRLCLFLSILCIVSACSSCGCAPKKADKPAQAEKKPSAELEVSPNKEPAQDSTPEQATPDYTLEPIGTPLPNLADDTSGADLGVFGEYVFGIVVAAKEDVLVLKIQDKYFSFAWTDRAKHHYEKLGVQIGSEVGLPYGTAEDGSYTTDAVELVE